MSKSFRPIDFQKPLPMNKIILDEQPSADSVAFDVVFVGAGPASLGGAIQLAKLIQEENEKSGGKLGEISIGVLEKSSEIGGHILSGAVIKPGPFLELFPELKIEELPFSAPVKEEKVYFLTEKRAFKIPTPPPMKNHGNYIASLCEVTRWLSKKAEELEVQVFTGFPVKGLLVQDNAVIGVRTAESGLDHDGNKLPSYQPPTDVTAKVIVLGEGTRGMLAQAFSEWQGIKSPNPQIYAIGVKELWQTKTPIDYIVHSMGWPLKSDEFGGSFMYPLEKNVVAIGLVIGMDYRDTGFDPHYVFQKMKTHPLFKEVLDGGEMLEWGAKTIPEGGYYSIPERLSGNGVVVIGDSAGFVDVPSLKGVHYALSSGMLAAKTIFEALKGNKFDGEALGEYDKAVRSSFTMRDLWKTRNMRLAFKNGLYWGGFKAGLMTLMGGKFPGGMIKMESDNEAERVLCEDSAFVPDGKLTFSKVEGVYKSGNATRDSIPSHLLDLEDVSPEVANFYAHLCPAGVYEVIDGKLRINAPNCIDCKATDILAARWTPREAGSGPRYKRM